MVEEPGEEPKLYRQDTGELVGDGAFIDPFLNQENNEHPNELPPKHRTRTPTEKSANSPSTSQPTAKLYKDIDELIEKLRLEQQQQHTGKKPAEQSNKPASSGS